MKHGCRFRLIAANLFRIVLQWERHGNGLLPEHTAHVQLSGGHIRGRVRAQPKRFADNDLHAPRRRRPDRVRLERDRAPSPGAGAVHGNRIRAAQAGHPGHTGRL